MTPIGGPATNVAVEGGDPSIVPAHPTSADLAFLALTAWREALGESSEGRRAVMHVILNRVKAKAWPNDAFQVCTQPFQFSCYNANDPIVGKFPRSRNEREYTIWLECLELAANPGPDPTQGATHYYNPYTVGIKPAWATTPTFTVAIGHHRFHKRDN